MSSSPLTDLADAVSSLTAVRPEALSVPQLQAASVTVLPLIDRLGGWTNLVIGELAARGSGTVPAASDDGAIVPVHAWLRDATNCGAVAAGSQVRTSTLLRQIPLVADAVLDGRVGQAQAAVLTRLVGKISPVDLVASQGALITIAADRDPQALANWVRHLIAVHCEPELDADERTAASKRYLQLRDNHDGTIRGSFLLPDGDAESLLTALEPLGRRTSLADTRSAGQRRADALIEICAQVLRHGTLPDSGGHRPQLSYLLPAGWAAGQPAPTLIDTLTAELTGTGFRAAQLCAVGAWTGPQTRARIESTLCDARISRILLDARGQVHGLESLTGEVTRAQRRALAARDGGCTTRGCTRPPAGCDTHHLTARADGGATAVHNLALLCRRHHLLWHQGRLQHHDLHLPWLTTRGTGPPDAAAVA